MYPYEVMYIIRPDVDDEARAALNERLAGIITAAGGTIDKTDDWGKRKLAYPINFLSEGHYMLVNFTAPGEVVYELERNMRINESIMRFLVTRTDA